MTSEATRLAVVQGQETPHRAKRAATDTTAANKKKLQARLADAVAAERAALDRRNAIVGRAVIEAMKTDEQLRALVAAALGKITLSKSERLEVSALMQTDTEGSPHE